MGGTRILVQAVLIGLAVTGVVSLAHLLAVRPTAIRGAVMMADPVPTRELPLANVEVTVAESPGTTVRSDASGFFTVPVPLRQFVRRGTTLSLTFRHPGYRTLELHDLARNKLCIARLTPLPQPPPSSPAIAISNVIVRYSVGATTMIDIGSAVKTFDVANSGNRPCKEHHPCSPDGRWAAAVGTATLDAGWGNEFRNARVSCIAGPCPFTRIEHANFNSPGQTLHVSALAWSDTATFLLAAEVFRPMVTDLTQETYPLKFGRVLTFTLPAAAEGVSIRAELDRNTIVFPLGPLLLLDWADCRLTVNKDHTKVYRCELKPGYRFY